jgi:hypothetical protein
MHAQARLTAAAAHHPLVARQPRAKLPELELPRAPDRGWVAIMREHEIKMVATPCPTMHARNQNERARLLCRDLRTRLWMNSMAQDSSQQVFCFVLLRSSAGTPPTQAAAPTPRPCPTPS